MQKLTGFNIISVLNRLPKAVRYPLAGNDSVDIEIVRVDMPEGPIVLRRHNAVSDSESNDEVSDIIIEKETVWRVADNLFEAHPLSLARLLGDDPSGKAVILENLLAYTSEFYLCYPGRMEHIAGNTVDRRGEEYLIWFPSDPHENAKLTVKCFMADISEIPSCVAVYESLEIKGAPKLATSDRASAEILRRHTQIQTALYQIGLQFGYRTWFKPADDGIYLNGAPLSEAKGILPSLDKTCLKDHAGAQDMDIIWFAEDGTVPAVIEVQYFRSISTSVMKMLELKALLPEGTVKRFIMAAPDEDRSHLISVSSKTFNRSLNIKYFPYTSVEELFSLCRRRNLKGISGEFLDSFIENIN
jgi:type II restriction enzyme